MVPDSPALAGQREQFGTREAGESDGEPTLPQLSAVARFKKPLGAQLTGGWREVSVGARGLQGEVRGLC